jgi:hypothetical protein
MDMFALKVLSQWRFVAASDSNDEDLVMNQIKILEKSDCCILALSSSDFPMVRSIYAGFEGEKGLKK